MLFWVFIGVPALLAILNAAQALAAWIHVRILRNRPPDPGGYTPRVALFVPCKGLDPDLEANLEAVARQDYPDHTVTYIVESTADPAHDTLRRVVARHPHTCTVIAGLARTCGQKNHNLLQGIASRGHGAEVIVTCDSDTRPDRTWLRRLVAPLADPRISVATGFRWLQPGEGRRTFAGYLHAMFNGYMATLVANKSFAAVWGGSMALRRDFFERHRLAERWSSTVVDDMTVSEILLASGERRVYVPSCVVVSDDAIPHLRPTLDWFTRQIVYVRYHLYVFWLMALALHISSALVVLSAPVLLVAHAYSGARELLWGGVAATLFTLSFMGQALLVRSLGARKFSAWRWCLYAPVGQVLAGYCLWQSALWRSLSWRDTTYWVGSDGRVIRIERAGAVLPGPWPVAEPASPTPAPVVVGLDLQTLNEE